MKASITELGLWNIFVKRGRYYQVFKLNHRQEKTAITQVFKAKDIHLHINHLKRESGYCYEIQRVRCKSGTHELQLSNIARATL